VSLFYKTIKSSSHRDNIIIRVRTEDNNAFFVWVFQGMRSRRTAWATCANAAPKKVAPLLARVIFGNVSLDREVGDEGRDTLADLLEEKPQSLDDDLIG